MFICWIKRVNQIDNNYYKKKTKDGNENHLGCGMCVVTLFFFLHKKLGGRGDRVVIRDEINPQVKERELDRTGFRADFQKSLWNT